MNARVWMLGGAVLSIAILVGAYFLGVSPALDGASRADRDVIQVEAQNTAQRAELERLKELEASKDTIATQLAELRESVPEWHYMSFYDRRIEQYASALALRITEISYAEEQVVGVDPNNPADEQAAAAAGGLVAVPVTITVEGELGGTLTFIRDLQAGERFVSVKSISITAAGDSTEPTDQATVIITGYVFVLPQDLQQAPADAGAGVAPTDGSASG
jgi:Tfp pilus assembly protein PilO